ncbi:hypothetical protein GCM10028798_22070 [Humibacter antri]
MTFPSAPAFSTRPTLRGTFGMSASTHWLATATAQSVLERGGNAFDAAVAAGFVLHIVEPHLNGPGGDLTGLFRAAGGEVRVLMGQGPAPAGATLEYYRDVRGSPRCRALVRSPRPFQDPWMPGYGCSPSTAPGNCQTCSRTRSTMPSTGIRCTRTW